MFSCLERRNLQLAILKFISRTNFMLSWVEHEKCFIRALAIHQYILHYPLEEPMLMCSADMDHHYCPEGIFFLVLWANHTDYPGVGGWGGNGIEQGNVWLKLMAGERGSTGERHQAIFAKWTLLYNMNSFGPVLFHQKRCYLLIPCFIETPLFDSSSLDSHQMPCSAASDLGQHCLPMSLLWDTRHKRVKFCMVNIQKDFIPLDLNSKTFQDIFPGKQSLPFQINCFLRRQIVS